MKKKKKIKKAIKKLYKNIENLINLEVDVLIDKPCLIAGMAQIHCALENKECNKCVI